MKLPPISADVYELPRRQSPIPGRGHSIARPACHATTCFFSATLPLLCRFIVPDAISQGPTARSHAATHPPSLHDAPPALADAFHFRQDATAPVLHGPHLSRDALSRCRQAARLRAPIRL
jgi:hypothetical protein